jgi:hypothetical protein
MLAANILSDIAGFKLPFPIVDYFHFYSPAVAAAGAKHLQDIEEAAMGAPTLPKAPPTLPKAPPTLPKAPPTLPKAPPASLLAAEGTTRKREERVSEARIRLRKPYRTIEWQHLDWDNVHWLEDAVFTVARRFKVIDLFDVKWNPHNSEVWFDARKK